MTVFSIDLTDVDWLNVAELYGLIVIAILIVNVCGNVVFLETFSERFVVVVSEVALGNLVRTSRSLSWLLATSDF